MIFLKKKGKNGFSLIEIVAALGLLSIGMLSILAAFSVSMKSTQRSERHTEVTMVLQRLAEEEKLKGYNLVEINPAINVDLTNLPYTYTVTVIDQSPGGLNDDKWVKKKVQVFWQRGLSTFDMSIDIYIFDL